MTIRHPYSQKCDFQRTASGKFCNQAFQFSISFLISFGRHTANLPGPVRLLVELLLWLLWLLWLPSLPLFELP